MSLFRLYHRCQLLRPRPTTTPITRSLHIRGLHQQNTNQQTSAPSPSFDPYNVHPSVQSSNTSSHNISSSSSTPVNSSSFYTANSHSSTTSSSYSSSTSTGSTRQSQSTTDDGTEQLRLSILNAALPLVPTHGWSIATLQAALQSTAYSPSVLSILQPEPVYCLAAHFLTLSTRSAFTAYHSLPLHQLTKQQRTTHLLTLLLSAHTPYLSHLPSLLGLCFTPSMARYWLPLLAELTDECMYVLGDSSTSTEWYSRRVAFAGVWVGGLVRRSVDRSAGGRDSGVWVERRVEEWVRGEEVLGEAGVMAAMYGGMGYNALLNVLAGKKP